MKAYKRIIIFSFFFLYSLNENINCKDFYIENSIDENYNSSLCSSINPSAYLLERYNYNNNNFEDDVICINIEEGKVQTVFLNDSYIYEFFFSDLFNKSDLLVNIYPLDCQIKITDYDNNSNVTEISNYKYNAYSAIILKDKKNSSYIRIKPLINPLEKNNKKRKYHLIINSFNKDNPQLIFNEKYPTLINFDSNLENIKLFYESKDFEEPIIFSFYIKERANFEVIINDNNQNNKIISYKDNIIINQNNILEKFNNISVIKIDKKNCTMIVKVSGNNSTFYLQKNILNLGFMPINTNYHYYYMEIFKGEEGEIMLHNKIINGFLFSKIIKKINMDERNISINDFPKYKEENYSLYNNYNDYSQKLNFYYNETNDCENGCYLLITYYSPKIELENINGAEYTLLARIWDADEFKTQLINIPLNEYVFGVIEPSFYSINAHYYTVFIPEDNNITIEFRGRNIDALIKKGILQINCLKKPYNSILLTKSTKLEEIEDEKLVINFNKNELNLKSFKNQYVSFAFTTKKNDNSNTLINYYYFRIIQQNSTNNNTIYPLDTNKVNLCQTSKIDQNYACYFILKNDYKELYYNFYIYAYGLEEVNYYNAWPINQIDHYSIDINNITKQYNNKIKTNDKGGYFELYFNENVNFNYILLEIHSNYEEILEVLFNFGGEFTSPSLNIYSYQSFYLNTNENKTFNFDYSSTNHYSVLINNILGEGYLCLNQNCDITDKKIFISGYFFLSFPISEEIKSIYFYSEKNLFFNLKIKNIMAKEEMEEIDYGYNYKNIKLNNNSFSNPYYLKDIYEKGVDINFFFDFKNNTNITHKIDIFGFAFNDEWINFIDNFGAIPVLTYLINNNLYTPGIYDPRTKSGFLSFDIIETVKEANYFTFIFFTPEEDTLEFSVKIFIDSKKVSLFFVHKNEYIRGAFYLFNDIKIQNKTFYIQFEENEKTTNISNNTYILEFSSSLVDIKPIFNNNFSYYSQINIGGVQQYFFSTNNITKGKKYNFTVQLNNTKYYSNQLNIFDFYLANYIIKFYKQDKSLNLDFINKKTIEIKKLTDESQKKSIYNFKIKNEEKNYNISYNYEFTYYVHLYLKNWFYDPQIINTTALIFYENYNYIYNMYSSYNHTSYNPYDELSFEIEDDFNNKHFYIYLFIKINVDNKEEMYYSTYLEINDALKKEIKEKKGKKNIALLIITFGSIFIITFIISIIICIKYSRKNKNLIEQVQAFTFTHGIDEEYLDKKKNRKSKNDKDYESTFI